MRLRVRVLKAKVTTMPHARANYLPVKLGGQHLYLMGLRDTKGTLFSGKENYHSVCQLMCLPSGSRSICCSTWAPARIKRPCTWSDR
jgi:hypothetical protein